MNTSIRGTISRAARSKLIAKIEAQLGRSVEVVYGAGRTAFAPKTGKIFLRGVDDDLIPRGTFFEEIQHLIDDAAGLNPRSIPASGSLEDAIFHREVFERMIDNPLLDISDIDGLSLLAVLEDVIKGLSR